MKHRTVGTLSGEVVECPSVLFLTFRHHNTGLQTHSRSIAKANRSSTLRKTVRNLTKQLVILNVDRTTLHGVAVARFQYFLPTFHSQLLRIVWPRTKLFREFNHQIVCERFKCKNMNCILTQTNAFPSNDE